MALADQIHDDYLHPHHGSIVSQGASSRPGNMALTNMRALHPVDGQALRLVAIFTMHTTY
jgi:hypothetical protein